MLNFHRDNPYLGWSWKKIEGLPLPLNELNELLGLIKDRQLIFRNGSDSLIWSLAKSGQYSAKVGYNVLANQGDSEDHSMPLKLFWINKIIPKAGIFVWLAVKKKILTTERLRKMGFEGPSRCVLCKAHEESVDHLLVNFPFFARCWRWLCAKLGWITILPNDIVSIFTS